MLGGKCIASSFHFTPCYISYFCCGRSYMYLGLCILCMTSRLQSSGGMEFSKPSPVGIFMYDSNLNSKGILFKKKKTTTTVLSIKYSNVPIMHLFNCYSFSDVFVASILWSSSHVTPLRNLLKSMNTLISRISALSSLLHFSDTGMSVFSWVRNTVT